MIVSQFQGSQTLVVDLKVSVALEKKFARLRAHFGHPLFQIPDPPLQCPQLLAPTVYRNGWGSPQGQGDFPHTKLPAAATLYKIQSTTDWFALTQLHTSGWLANSWRGIPIPFLPTNLDGDPYLRILMQTFRWGSLPMSSGTHLDGDPYLRILMQTFRWGSLPTSSGTHLSLPMHSHADI